MINLRVVMSTYERLARVQDVVGPQLGLLKFADRRRVVVRTILNFFTPPPLPVTGGHGPPAVGQRVEFTVGFRDGLVVGA
jgi:hypothetical protein